MSVLLELPEISHEGDISMSSSPTLGFGRPPQSTVGVGRSDAFIVAPSDVSEDQALQRHLQIVGRSFRFRPSGTLDDSSSRRQ